MPSAMKTYKHIYLGYYALLSANIKTRHWDLHIKPVFCTSPLKVEKTCIYNSSDQVENNKRNSDFSDLLFADTGTGNNNFVRK